MTRSQPQAARGFTLIELVIVVLVISILAAIAIPAYRDYVIRGQISNAFTTLSSMRAQMEQYYADNRTYAATSGGTYNPPCSTTTTAGQFSISCVALGSAPASARTLETNEGVTLATNPAASGYILVATGSQLTSGFTYTLDQSNGQTTTLSSSKWGSTSGNCFVWISKKGQSC